MPFKNIYTIESFVYVRYLLCDKSLRGTIDKMKDNGVYTLVEKNAIFYQK